jgi:hypothetical protein
VVAGEEEDVIRDTFANTSSVSHCGKMKVLRLLLQVNKTPFRPLAPPYSLHQAY